MSDYILKYFSLVNLLAVKHSPSNYQFKLDFKKLLPIPKMLQNDDATTKKAPKGKNHA